MAPSQQEPSKNAPTKASSTMRTWETKQLVTMALLAAIGALLSFLEGGGFGGFLNYDASFVPAMVGGFIFGPIPGFVIGAITAIIHALLTANFWGALMNLIGVAAFVVPGAAIYRHNKSRTSAVIGLIVGGIASCVAMILINLVITPIYTGMPVSSVAALILPLLLPFNIAKAAVNSLLVFFLYKPIAHMVRPERDHRAQ